MKLLRFSLMWLFLKSGGTLASLLVCTTASWSAQETSPKETPNLAKQPPADETTGAPNADEDLSLEDLLKTEVPELTKENPATRDLWNRLVESLSKNDFDSANGYAASLVNIRDVLTPLRLEYCVVYEQIRNSSETSQTNVSPTLGRIVQIDQRTEALKVERQSLQEERPKIYKKIEDQNKAKATSAIIGSLIGAGLGAGLGAAAGGGDGAAIGAGAGAAAGAVGGYGVAASASPEVRLQYVQQRLQEISAELAGAEAERSQLSLQLSGEDKQREADIAKNRKELAERVIRIMDRLAADNEFQPATALANAFLKFRGMDSELSLKSSEIYRAQEKVSKAIKIARVIRKNIQKILGEAGQPLHPWAAVRELEKMKQMAKNALLDENQLKVLEKELYEIQERIENEKESAEKQRQDCLALGKEDAVTALAKMDIYGRTYPDDPKIEESRLALKRLHNQQAEKRVQKQMAAALETLANDPEKAKEVLKNLLGQDFPELEKAILESKISAEFRRLHSQEIFLIRRDVDDALKYLEKYILETGSDRADVDLSDVYDKFSDLQFHQSESSASEDFGVAGMATSESNETGFGGGVGVLSFGIAGNYQEGSEKSQAVSGGFRAKQNQAQAMAGQLTESASGGNRRLFSFVGRLYVGVENISRALSLLEQAKIRGKKLQEEPEVDKILRGRLDGLCKSIEIGLEQMKEYREKEVHFRKIIWIFIGASAATVLGLLVFVLHKFKKD